MGDAVAGILLIEGAVQAGRQPQERDGGGEGLRVDLGEATRDRLELVESGRERPGHGGIINRLTT